MAIFSNKIIIGVVCIIIGVLILPFIGLPTILAWIIGILLIIYGIMVLQGKK